MDYITENSQLIEQNKKQTTLYVVENTVFFSTQDLKIVTVENFEENLNTARIKSSKGLNTAKIFKTKKEIIKQLNTDKIAQEPFSVPPF